MNSRFSQLIVRAVAIVLIIGGLILIPLRGFQSSNVQLYINDIFGLSTELALRPIMGVGYVPGSVAFIDNTGAIVSVIGPAGNCVTVGGSSVPCGGTSGSSGSTGSGTAAIRFADSEVVSGLINGLNVGFTVANAPNPSTSLHVYQNGIRLTSPGDYKTSGLTGLSMTRAPGAGDLLTADYRY